MQISNDCLKKKLNYKYASCGNFNIYEIQDALRQKKIEREREEREEI